MAAVPYTWEEVRQVRYLAGDGLTDPQIERKTGIPARRVKGIRTKHRIESPWKISTRRKGSAPLTDAELAQLRAAVGWRPDFDYAADDLAHARREAVSVS